MVNRGNAIRLEEKEKREKELLRQIIVEADEYKAEFYRKREASCETKRATNRKREQVRRVERQQNRVYYLVLPTLMMHGLVFDEFEPLFRNPIQTCVNYLV